MDCMTISTFRSLEQQAIKKGRYETFAQERGHKTTVQKHSCMPNEKKALIANNPTAKLNYLA